MSHSGSRALGFQICRHYTDLAQQRCYGLPDEMRHLAWLDLDEDSGQHYWASMQLAGDYASANHHLIHHHVAKAAGLKAVWQVEHHHNFAWLEEHDGRELVVHRKGATPAEEGVLGLIPGSMADPGALVRGKGVEGSLRSCSHGAGRAMSRSAAKRRLTRSQQKKTLAARGVTLLSGGLDEAPDAYKPVEDVLAAQTDLVDVIGLFQPKIVKMADD
jgi:tRNA-splicing ligase RtcB